MSDYEPCAICGKMGYTDERTHTPAGHLCARCARPDIFSTPSDTPQAKV